MNYFENNHLCPSNHWKDPSNHPECPINVKNNGYKKEQKAIKQLHVFSSDSSKYCSNSPKRTSTFHSDEAQHTLVSSKFILSRRDSSANILESPKEQTVCLSHTTTTRVSALHSQVQCAVTRDQECKPQRFGFIIQCCSDEHVFISDTITLTSRTRNSRNGQFVWKKRSPSTN